MWGIETTELWEHGQKHYLKKRPREFEAVFLNLKAYIAQLNVAKNSKCVQARYVHPEKSGVVAIGERPGPPGLQATRIYTYPDDETKKLWLITIGNKQDQPKDVKISATFALSLLASKSKEAP